MRRSQDQSLAGQVGPHEPRQHLLRQGIKRSGGLVEQPDRPVDRNQARQRQAPTLPGGEIVRGQPRQPVEADRRQGRVSFCRLPTEEICPERQILAHRQRGLERILVAQIVGVLADGQLGVAALEHELSRVRPDQARDQAKQRGLARAVGAGDEQGLAGIECKAQASEDLAAAADAGEVGAGEAHHRVDPKVEAANSHVAAQAGRWSGSAGSFSKRK